MSTDYQQQAIDFAKKYNIKLKVKHVDYDFYFHDDDKRRNIYKCTLSRNGKRYTFKFGQSIINTGLGIEPSMYDILSCIEKYEVDEDVDDWARKYGYHDGKTKIKDIIKIHEACLKEYKNVMRLFGDIIEELREIN